jgi:ferredoxin
LCRAECPVNAIYADHEISEDQIHFISLNEELSRKWPSITAQKAPAADADKWNGIANKISLLVMDA